MEEIYNHLHDDNIFVFIFSFQLSKIFSDFGYEPKQGARLSIGNEVSGSDNRIYYVRPPTDMPPGDSYGVLGYRVMDLSSSQSVKSISHEGLVTFVPPSGILVGSDFTRGSEDWSIVGNAVNEEAVVYEASSRGPLSHYVYASDNSINSDHASKSDQALWYFKAPDKFLGHHGIAYGGYLEFTLSSFQGDYSVGNLNSGTVSGGGLHLLYLECAKCNLNKGVRLAFPLSATPAGFSGITTKFTIPLHEKGGWLEGT